MNKEQAIEIRAKIEHFNWYHQIEIGSGVFTPSRSINQGDTEFNNPYLGTWKKMEAEVQLRDMRSKSVLDAGGRDGKFGLLAERLGASSVTVFDNDLSPGGKLLCELLGSIVQHKQGNVLTMEFKEEFDVVFAFGLLYHLREPMLGLKKLVEALKPGGMLLIESGMMDFREIQHIPMLYCPVETSPYEHSSCTFFNDLGLQTTLRSFGAEFVCGGMYGWPTHGNPPHTQRGFYEFRKVGSEKLKDYWHSTHSRHTDYQLDASK